MGTISSFGSASSVGEDVDSRDVSAGSSTSLSAADSGRKQSFKVGSKSNGKGGKDSPWVMRPNNSGSVEAR